jgi:dTDP-glucose 4,6-dehydratase
MHLAMSIARSMDPLHSFQTNIVGTSTLLETAPSFWRALPSGRRTDFRFHHVSTDFQWALQ